MPDSTMLKVIEQAREMARSGDWSKAAPRHFVAVYEFMHERVYGVLPAEMNSVSRTRAAAACSRLMKREFALPSGEPDKGAFANYLRWAWMREDESEKWRRAHGREGRRLTWGLLFGGGLLTDYRVALARKHG